MIVDAAGGQIGGAARYRGELLQYLHRTRREDVRVVGAERRLTPTWLLRREAAWPVRTRRVAVNNVSFVSPGGERWTLLASLLYFLTDDEWANLHPSLRSEAGLRAPIVHMAARRSHVIVAPCMEMAERITRVLPDLRSRVTVRMHPVSAELPSVPRDPVILCPVFFAAYKHMVARIRELLIMLDQYDDPSVELVVTAKSTEIPAGMAHHPRLRLVGQLDHKDLRQLWARSRAVFFPSAVEAFGYPLAEARVNGQSVIALDTAQNREIAGPALCGFTAGDMESLGSALEQALTRDVCPDPAPFDPDAYFTWLLGRAS